MNTPATRAPLGGLIPEQQAELSLFEISRTCAVQSGYVIELIDEGVITPVAGREAESWRFTGWQVRHVKVAWRLQRDLGVNLAGAALALQLLDEVAALRAQIAAVRANSDLVDCVG